MPIYKRGKYFCEESVPGKRYQKVKHCFLIKRIIFEGKTKLQRVLIFDNEVYGRVFCLDGIVQLSESDEFIYHEMMVHPLAMIHPRLKRALIIGGGDGGVLRELEKHLVKEIDLCEIDKEIIRISQKYLSFVCQNSFQDRRVKIFIRPGEELVKERKNYYDLIFIDCTNPEPNSISFFLYTPKFYRQVFASLKKEGMFITLGASFLDWDFIKKIVNNIKKVFPYTAILKFCMPSYHCGEYSFIIGSKKLNPLKPDWKKIKRRFNRLNKKYSFRYYSPEIHQASLVLPFIYQQK